MQRRVEQIQRYNLFDAHGDEFRADCARLLPHAHQAPLLLADVDLHSALLPLLVDPQSPLLFLSLLVRQSCGQ